MSYMFVIIGRNSNYVLMMLLLNHQAYQQRDNGCTFTNSDSNQQKTCLLPTSVHTQQALAQACWFYNSVFTICIFALNSENTCSQTCTQFGKR